MALPADSYTSWRALAALSVLVLILVWGGPSVAQVAVELAPPYSSSSWRTHCSIEPPDAADSSTCVVLSGEPNNTHGTYKSTVTLWSPNSGNDPQTAEGSSTTGFVVTNFEVVDAIPKGLTSVTYTTTFNHRCERASSAILTTGPPFSTMYVIDTTTAAYRTGRDIKTEHSGSSVINPCEGSPAQTNSVKLTHSKGKSLPSGRVTVTIQQQFSAVALRGFTGQATFVDAGSTTVVRTTGGG